MNTSVMMTDKAWELMAKYLAGECDEAEMRSLRAWSQHDNNLELLNRMNAIFSASPLNDKSLENSLRDLTERIRDDELL